MNTRAVVLGAVLLAVGTALVFVWHRFDYRRHGMPKSGRQVYLELRAPLLGVTLVVMGIICVLLGVVGAR